MSADRRRSARVPGHIPASLHLLRSPLVKEGHIIDMSICGIALESDEEFEDGMDIFIKISPSVHVRGEIIHQHKTGPSKKYGVKFTDWNKSWENYLRKHGVEEK